MLHKAALEPNLLSYVIPTEYPLLDGACNSLRIARIKSRQVKLLREAAPTSTNFTHFYGFEMHYSKPVRATDLKYGLLYINSLEKLHTTVPQGNNLYFSKSSYCQVSTSILLLNPAFFDPNKRKSIWTSVPSDKHS